MATITANTSSNNWNTNGAWIGGVQPSAADDVVIPASAVVTIPSATTVLSRSTTVQASGTLAFAATTSILSIGDTTAGAGNVALSISGTATITLTAVGRIDFLTTSATQQTITTGGKTLPSLTFNATSNGSWLLSDATTVSTTGTVTLTKGTLNTGGQTCSFGFFSSSNSNTRVLTLGATALSLTGTGGTPWNLGTVTGLTFNVNTSSITMNQNQGTFNGGGLTYNNVTLTPTSNNVQILSGANTFANLTITSADSRSKVQLTANQIVTTLYTQTGTGGSSTVNRAMIFSSILGTQRTITAASISLTQADFRDIIGAGAATWSGTSVGDCLGNTNITFTTPVTRYWVAFSGGNWGSTSSWSTTSGGASGASAPLAQDTCIIDANSITSGSRTITMDSERSGKDITFTGVLNNPILALGSVTALAWFGSVTFASGMTTSGNTTPTFYGRGTHTFDPAGVSLSGGLTFSSVSGTYTLMGALTFFSGLTVNYGTFNSNNHAMSGSTFNSNATTTRALTFGTSVITLNSSGNFWNITQTGGLTISAYDSEIVSSYNSTATKTFTGGGLMYGALSQTNASSTGSFTISGTNTFRALNFSGAARTIIFPASVTTNVNDSFNIFGTAGNLQTLNSSSSGVQATIKKGYGVVSKDYLSIKDIRVQGGAQWYAGVNSTNTSNNTGWTFTAQPTAIPQQARMMAMFN